MRAPVDVAFLGFTLADSDMEPILRLGRNMPTQTQAFGWSVVGALKSAGLTVGLLSAAPVSNYPLMPQLFFRGGPFEVGDVPGMALGFVNALAVKHVTRLLACLSTGTRTLRTWKSRTLLIHGIHSPFLWYGVVARRTLGMTTVVILTDPPGVVVPTDSALARFLKGVDVDLVRAALARVDGVLALTEALALDFAPGRPFFVLEGIQAAADPSHDRANVRARLATETRSGASIVYAGGLSSAYGVDRLVEAVEDADVESLTLQILGKGDLLSWVEGRAEAGSRVLPPRFLPRPEVIETYGSADLLVQPRPVDQRISRYSFPSKLLEYMGSGTPVLTTRLPGIPADYDDYVYWIDDDSTSGIQSAIEHVLRLPRSERLSKGRSAAEFVRRTRSSAGQGAKISRFLGSLQRS